MTKKQLSKLSGISVTRISQLMISMVENIDYTKHKIGKFVTRLELTEIGIAKVMNRNTKGGRKAIPKELHAKRKKKILIN